MKVRRLERRELPKDTVALARYLLGKVLVHESHDGTTSGVIVETEAYLVGDAAAHSFNGPTERNRSLFLERGHAYVYFIYGTWFCMNVSGGTEGVGSGVLLRALEPLDGTAIMQERRPHSKPLRLASGPGCLATAMAIDRSLDGLDLCAKGRLWLGAVAGKGGPASIGNSVRIGLTKEAHRKLRFYRRGSPSLSGGHHLNT